MSATLLSNKSSPSLQDFERDLIAELEAELKRRGELPPCPLPSLTPYQSDPVLFAREVLRAEPWERQAEIMRAVAAYPRVTVRACHNSGKSWMAGCLIQWWVRCFDPSLVVTTAGNMRQVKDVLWQEVHNRQLQASLPGEMTLMKLVVSPTQRAHGLSTNDPIYFQGWHEKNILVIVDEASGVEEPIWEAIEGILTGPNAKLLLIGNPNNPAGTFYASHSSPLYKPFHIAAADVPDWLLPSTWAEERKQEWGEDNPAYQVRVLGEFPDQGDDALIALRWVTAAQEREAAPSNEPVEIGVDVARFGQDENVAVIRQGQEVRQIKAWRGQDLVQTAGHVAALALAHDAKTIKVDDIGVGGGVVDILKAQKLPVIGVNVGKEARDKENYFNLRSEVFQGLADRFKDGEIALPGEDPVLLAQLTALRKLFTPKGQMKLESKDDLRKRLPKMGSPDRADALALAFHSGGPRWLPGSWLGPAREMR
jgi:phage terminase large subunit